MTVDERFEGELQEFPRPLQLLPISDQNFDARAVQENLKRIEQWLQPFGGRVPEAYQLAQIVGGSYGEGLLTASTGATGDVALEHGLGKVPRMVFWSTDFAGLGGVVLGSAAGRQGLLGSNETPWTATTVYLRGSLTSEYAFILI